MGRCTPRVSPVPAAFPRRPHSRMFLPGEASRRPASTPLTVSLFRPIRESCRTDTVTLAREAWCGYPRQRGSAAAEEEWEAGGRSRQPRAPAPAPAPARAPPPPSSTVRRSSRTAVPRTALPKTARLRSNNNNDDLRLLLRPVLKTNPASVRVRIRIRNRNLFNLPLRRRRRRLHKTAPGSSWISRCTNPKPR